MCRTFAEQRALELGMTNSSQNGASPSSSQPPPDSGADERRKWRERQTASQV